MNLKLSTSVAYITLTFSLVSCDPPGSSGNGDSASYQETKMTLEEQEKISPMSFLSTDGTYRKNLIGEWVLEGTVSNAATIATYKDVVLNVSFYSKTNTHLGSERHTIYEFFPARQAKNFKIKTFGYKGANSVNWDIEEAASVN